MCVKTDDVWMGTNTAVCEDGDKRKQDQQRRVKKMEKEMGKRVRTGEQVKERTTKSTPPNQSGAASAARRERWSAVGLS